jgi:hypothetical protein
MATDRRTVTAVTLLLAVVLAGCGAPVAQSPDTSGTQTVSPTTGTATATPATATPSEPRAINVTNGSLSVDPNRVFERVQSLQGTDVDPPRVVRVYNNMTDFANQSEGVLPGGSRRFYRLAGMTAADVNISVSVTRQKNGYVTGLGSIVLYVGENASTVDELLLVAHEFTHYLQVRDGRQQRLIETLGSATVTDERYVIRALSEGGAVVTTDAYLATYADTSTTNSEMYTRVQSALPDGHIAKYENGKYVHGAEYMASRTESPANLSAVYETPPRTSEQILHELGPDAEPPTPLSVDVQTGDEWVASGSDRMGEAFLRTALEAGVGEQQAVSAAAGWGNDTVRFLRPADGDGKTAFAWVLRWDDAANQSEFQSAYEQSLDQRGTETDDVWRLENRSVSATLTAPTERTSVVVFGPDALVANATVTGSPGTVRVSTP